ncbi:PREDICTED: 28S ribosomal protein S6, mitochondrial [Apaloderma vittatum]|uniref:28S ribosomal protein S6, mitochondrial n=1 Tax=Apaloderma vittatum TaxID=57397 RepID=UPI00052139FA|nr:PREDICTED: 28S ribosomal protein S6, mitochondrial [Apaloderma vittatum]
MHVVPANISSGSVGSPSQCNHMANRAAAILIHGEGQQQTGNLCKGQPKWYQPETAAVLKRTVEALMERGAIVRNLENLGERSLPYKISKHKERHRRGGYFLIDLEGPPSIVSTMMDHLGRDIDIIRRAFLKHPVSKTEECSGIIPVNYEDKLSAKKK